MEQDEFETVDEAYAEVVRLRNTIGEARAFERENNQLREHLESVLPHAEELSRSGLTDDVCKAARAFLANTKFRDEAQPRSL